MHVSITRFVLGASRSETYVECRDCGTTLSTTPTACPGCGSNETVVYELS